MHRPVAFAVLGLCLTNVGWGQVAPTPGSNFAAAPRPTPGVNGVPGSIVYVPRAAAVRTQNNIYIINNAGTGYGAMPPAMTSAPTQFNAFLGGSMGANPFQQPVVLPSATSFLGGAALPGMPVPYYNFNQVPQYPFPGGQAPVVGLNPLPGAEAPKAADAGINLVVPFNAPANGFQQANPMK